MRVMDVMTPHVIGVPETASLWDALKLMTGHKISALVVFDPIGAPVGVLSEGDLLRRAEFGAEKKRPRWFDMLIGGGRAARDYARSHGRRVDEIMTRGIVSIEETAEVAEAVELMLHARVRRLLVMHASGLVGILSRSDLVRALMKQAPAECERSDHEIQEAVETAIASESWAPVSGVRVVVDNGVVSLEGALSDVGAREGLRVLAENVPGVKSVRDRLAWIEPNSGYYVPAPGEG